MNEIDWEAPRLDLWRANVDRIIARLKVKWFWLGWTSGTVGCLLAHHL